MGRGTTGSNGWGSDDGYSVCFDQKLDREQGVDIRILAGCNTYAHLLETDGRIWVRLYSDVEGNGCAREDR